MRISLVFSIAALFSSLAVSAAADDAPQSGAETVVVSATRTEQPADLTGESVSVVTSQDLSTEQTVVLSDALKETPALSVSRNGGIGETTSIRIRGAEPGQTLVLIDGVRINDPSAPDGGAVLEDLLVNNIDRVEILRGPQSTLYGSDAIGGVVDVLTKRGGDTPLSLQAEAEGGSYETVHGNVAATGTIGDLDYGTAANAIHTNSVSAADSRSGNPEPDGYHAFGATANLRWHATSDVSVDLRGYTAISRNSFDGFPPPNFTLMDTPEFGDDKLFAGYAGVNWALLDGRFQNRFAVTASHSERQDFDPVVSPALEFDATGEALRFEYQGIYSFSDKDQATFGYEHERTAFNTASPAPFDPNPAPTLGSVRTDSAYAQLQGQPVDALTLTGGIRLDNHQTFGSHTSLKLAGAWQLFDGNTILHANYGDGFKAPSLFELFSIFSNPDHALAPEVARGWEAGAAQLLFDDRVRLSATYFVLTSKNEIVFVSCFGVVSPECAVRPEGFYDNVARSRSDGVELEGGARLTDTVAVSANMTLMKAVDLSDHSDLARTPRTTGFARVTWTPDKRLTLAASVGYTGSSFDQAEEQGALKAYTLIDLFATYALSDRYEVFARLQDVANTRYETTLGFGSPAREAYAGVRVRL